MAQIISKIFDAISANVKLGDLRDFSSRFEAYIFVLLETKNEENRTIGILDIWV